MKSTMSAVALALSLSMIVPIASADAQRGRMQPREQKQAKPSGAKVTIGDLELNLSAQALPAIQELQAAVNANDVATIPAKVAAAEAKAKSADDRYFIAALRFKAASAANDEAAKAAALQAMQATGKMSATQSAQLQVQAGVAAYNAKKYDEAAAAFEAALAANPGDLETQALLAYTRNSQGKPQEGLRLLKDAMAKSRAAGAKPKEEWFKRGVSMAYEARMPEAIELSRQWVIAYPTPSNWRDSLRIYRNLAKPAEPVLLDALRLGRVVKALQGDIDYHPYGYAAIVDLSPAEAKAVVEEGIAAGSIKGSDKNFRDIIAEATTKMAGQKDRLGALTRDALAGSEAKMAVTAGNIHYGYGDYAKAAELYRAALTKSGGDKAMINLRLGMSLALAGDKAGATEALNAVSGPRAEVAKYWLAYLQTSA